MYEFLTITVIFLAGFAGTFTGLLLYDFLRVKDRLEKSSKIKEIQRAMSVRPMVEISSPSKRLKDKQFLDSIAPEHE